MVTNTLKIKCVNHNILSQVKEILITEDDFGRKIFTMQKLLPLVEENYTTNDFNKYDFTWCVTNHGIVLDIISEFVLEDENQLIIYYHSMTTVNDSWLTVLCDYIKSLLASSIVTEDSPITFDHKFYELDHGFSGHYYWDGVNISKSISCGLIDFAAKHHPGLMNYLKIQHEKYNSAKVELAESMNHKHNPKTISDEKNNCTKNEELWKK